MISIGIGEYAITDERQEIVVTHALGSCVALVLYCPKSKYTAMAHVVLPKRDSDFMRDSKKEAYFAHDIIPKLLDFFIEDQACKKHELKVMMVGGAQAAGKDLFKVGERNVEEVRQILQGYNLNYDDSEVLGRYSRSVQIEVETGEVTIKKQKMRL